MASSMDYDVLVVDRMLPRRDGLSIIESLRAEDNKTPVLILSALGEVDDRVTGLRAGGDDYLVKPYAFTELLARIEVLARRSSPAEAATSLSRSAGWRSIGCSRKVERDGEEILLQPREFRLLEYLMKNAGQGGDPHHAAGERLGLSLRPADQRHRRAHVAACAPRSTRATPTRCCTPSAAPAT